MATSTLKNLDKVTTPTVSITPTTGSLATAQVKRTGNVVELILGVYNTASVAAGAFLFEGTLNTAGLRPLDYSTGVGFWGNRAMIGYIRSSGQIAVRNVSPNAMQSSASDYVTLSFTYVIGGVLRRLFNRLTLERGWA